MSAENSTEIVNSLLWEVKFKNGLQLILSITEGATLQLTPALVKQLCESYHKMICDLRPTLGQPIFIQSKCESRHGQGQASLNV